MYGWLNIQFDLDIKDVIVQLIYQVIGIILFYIWFGIFVIVKVGGVLFYGFLGIGKIYLVRVLVYEYELVMILVFLVDIELSCVGEIEKII